MTLPAQKRTPTSGLPGILDFLGFRLAPFNPSINGEIIANPEDAQEVYSPWGSMIEEKFRRNKDLEEKLRLQSDALAKEKSEKEALAAKEKSEKDAWAKEQSEKNAFYQNLLLEAIKRNENPCALRILFAMKLNLNYQEPGSGKTCLHFAHENGNTTMISILVSKGADPRILSKDNTRAVPIGYKYGRVEASLMKMRFGEGQY